MEECISGSGGARYDATQCVARPAWLRLRGAFPATEKGKCLDTVARTPPPLSLLLLLLLLPLCPPYLRDSEGHWIRNVLLQWLIGGFLFLSF